MRRRYHRRAERWQRRAGVVAPATRLLYSSLMKSWFGATPSTQADTRISLKDQWSFNAIFFMRHFLPDNARLRRWSEEVRRRTAEAVEGRGPGAVVPVERVPGLTPAEFQRRFLSTGTPVIFPRAAAGWPSAERWTLDEFKRRFGDKTIRLVHQQGLTDDELDPDEIERWEEMNFGEFLDQTIEPGGKYMRFSPLLEQFPELLDDLSQDFLKTMPGRTLGQTFMMFIGGPKTMTPMHNSPVPFFFVNVTGVKKWRLVSNRWMPLLDPAPSGFGYNHSGADFDAPDADGFPGLGSVDRWEATLEPGDVMYVPSWLWHCVANETPTIGVRCGFISPRGAWAESPALFTVHILAARNPTVWEGLYRAFIKKDFKDRDKMFASPSVLR